MPPKRARAAATDATTATDVNHVEEFNKLVQLPVPEDLLDAEISTTEMGNKRCCIEKLRDGSLLYRPARIVILSKSSHRVRNQELHAAGEDADWNLGAELIEKQCWSPDQYTRVEPVTMTQIAAKLKDEVGDCVCKVEFTKLPEPAAMAALLQQGAALIEQSSATAAEKKKMYKRLHERTQHGEYRIMRGYILRSEDQARVETDTGMIKFIDADLMAAGKHCERLVNVRAIKALTFKLVKYVVK